MAKHPHKLILLNDKTWRCMRDGCNFFVHRGLEHVLIGKQAMCWNCEDSFQVAQWSLKDPKPICDDCRTIRAVGVTSKKMESMIERDLINGKKDQIEVIEPDDTHSPDCTVWEGGECTCK